MKARREILDRIELFPCVIIEAPVRASLPPQSSEGVPSHGILVESLGALAMNSFATFLSALAAIVAVFAGTAHAGDDDAPDGRALFYMSCATCHLGSSALLGVVPPPDLFRDSLPRGDSEEVLFAVIRSGTGTGRMPAFAEGLDEAETRALVRFIRSRRALE
jgi:mono/diheme cytochrome c family protein